MCQLSKMRSNEMAKKDEWKTSQSDFVPICSYCEINAIVKKYQINLGYSTEVSISKSKCLDKKSKCLDNKFNYFDRESIFSL